MELLYPDEYFLELLEENLYNFNKEGYDDLTVNIELDPSVDELDWEYLKSKKGFNIKNINFNVFKLLIIKKSWKTTIFKIF